MAEVLYKYLDAEGGLKMLKNSNLQFTNATKFNDPFDCHPALFDYAHVPTTPNNWPPADFIQSKGELDMENLRNSTWICCLSKVFDSLLMWAYYTKHKGICIGLNKDAVVMSCQRKFISTILPFPTEVQYKDIHQKPNYFGNQYSWLDLLTTKAKDWEHEQEIRIIAKDPMWINGVQDIPTEFKKDESVDWKEVRHYPCLSRECFESVYLGTKISDKDKDRIIKAAKKLNPNIKIYQMKTDPEAFKLKEEII